MSHDNQTARQKDGAPTATVTIAADLLFGQPWDPYACVICGFPVPDDASDRLAHLAEHGAVPKVVA